MDPSYLHSSFQRVDVRYPRSCSHLSETIGMNPGLLIQILDPFQDANN